MIPREAVIWVTNLLDRFAAAFILVTMTMGTHAQFGIMCPEVQSLAAFITTPPVIADNSIFTDHGDSIVITLKVLLARWRNGNNTEAA